MCLVPIQGEGGREYKYQQGDERGKPDDREAANKGVGNHCSDNGKHGNASIDKIINLCCTNARNVEFFDQIHNQVDHPSS
ncbi:hypothetical protein OROMI_015079 [Orobanche minor]